MLVLTIMVTIALLIGGFSLIFINARAMQRDIFLNALSFGELTNDRIVTSFEQFYQTKNFLQFRKDINPLLGKNSDIAKIEITGQNSELYYDSSEEQDAQYDGTERRKEIDINRSRGINPSLLFSSGEIVYAKKSADNEWLAIDIDEQLREFPSGGVINVLYPNQNFRHNVIYELNYTALWDRIYSMAFSIILIIIGSIILASIIGVYFASQLVRPIRELEHGVSKIAKGAFGAQIPVKTVDEIGTLTENFNHMSKTLKRNTEELVEKERITHELDLAKEIQQTMLPEKAPELKNFAISGSLSAANRIGGDIYDYLKTPTGETLIFIADVTGHGVPAGLVSSITNSSLYSYSTTHSNTEEIMTSMNTIIFAKTRPNMFATAVLLKCNDQQRSLHYCNAGHEQIIHYQAATKQIRLLEKGGMALGMIPDVSKLLEEKSVDVGRGDVLVIYTDGLPEAWKTKTENLGMKPFINIVRTSISKNKTVEGIRKSILKHVKTYMGKYPQQDDITLVVIKAKE